MDNRQVAEAFSGHRFHEVRDRLAPEVRWVLPGRAPIEGKEAVLAACEATAVHLAGLASTDFTRFVSVADGDGAAVDAVARYVDHDGTVSVVSSADVYELDEAGRVTTVTSYAVELSQS